MSKSDSFTFFQCLILSYVGKLFQLMLKYFSISNSLTVYMQRFIIRGHKKTHIPVTVNFCIHDLLHESNR